MTGAELAEILRVNARMLGQNAAVMQETRADLRRLAQILDPQECTHQARASRLGKAKTRTYFRCLDCDHEWSVPV